MRAVAGGFQSASLLELPVTILRRPRRGAMRVVEPFANLHSLSRRALNKFVPTEWWLRPDCRNRRRLIDVVDTCVSEGRDYVEFMLHSSELMPGGSPRFPTDAHIERLYDDLEALFSAASQKCVGMTLSEYRARFVAMSTSEDADLVERSAINQTRQSEVLVGASHGRAA